MTVKTENKPVELSYLDLCKGLTEDIASDKLIPESIRANCLRRVQTLAELLKAYSD